MAERDATGSESQPDAAERQALLAREVELLSDRFRAMPEGRLGRPLPPYPTRAEAGRQVAQLLADAALGLTHPPAAAPPVWREVPELSPFAVGDQIAVTGHDLLAALAVADEAASAWTRTGRRTTGEILAAVLESLRALRLAL